MLGEFRSKPKSSLAWVLWWRADQEDLQDQVASYDELGWLDSFRKLSVLCLLFSASLSVVLVLFTKAYAGLFDVVIIVGLAAFIYRGHRWAMLAAMGLWTLEKIGSTLGFSGNPVALASAPVTLLWWAIYTHAFYMAFLVEQMRRKHAGKQVAEQPSVP